MEPTKKEEVKKKNETINGNCCECPKDKKISEIEKSERMMTIYFENFLQNNVFVKRYQKIVKFDSFCSRFFLRGWGEDFYSYIQILLPVNISATKCNLFILGTI